MLGSFLIRPCPHCPARLLVPYTMRLTSPTEGTITLEPEGLLLHL
jgi:hypothetical protein